MSLLLNVLSAISAFLAAGFWFAASRPIPQPNPTTDGSLGRAFEDALQASATANRRAARFAGAAALLQGLATVVRF